MTLCIPPIAVVLTVKGHDDDRIVPLETVQMSGGFQSGPPPSGWTFAVSLKVTDVSDGFQFEPVIVTEVPAVPTPVENAAQGDVGLPVRVNGAKAVAFPPAPRPSSSASIM